MKVLIADPVDKAGIEALQAHAEVDVKTGLKPEELKSIIGDYDALVVRSETQATAEIIEAGKKLQVIARAGVGLDLELQKPDGRIRAADIESSAVGFLFRPCLCDWIVRPSQAGDGQRNRGSGRGHRCTRVIHGSQNTGEDAFFRRRSKTNGEFSIFNCEKSGYKDRSEQQYQG